MTCVLRLKHNLIDRVTTSLVTELQ